MVSRTRSTARPTRQEMRIAAIILVVIVAIAASVFVVLHDSGPARPKTAPRTAATSPKAPTSAPTAPDDAAVLLNNTPLAINATDAAAINAARPLDAIPANFARPFFLPIPTAASAKPPAAALDCLTQAVYYEAASESDTGKRAVAQVVLNRMRSPLFPHTVCGVVYEGSQQRTGCQFSFTCDGSLARQPSVAGWASARRIALAALSGTIERSVGLSTHYHANYVVPYWANSLDKVATIGAHIFYTMRGGLGRPPGFGARYEAGLEGLPNMMPGANSAGDLAAALLGLSQPTLPGQPGAPARVAPVNRTEVKDDQLGTVLKPNLTPVAPPAIPVLRADEKPGELVVDKTKGALAPKP